MTHPKADLSSTCAPVGLDANGNIDPTLPDVVRRFLLAGAPIEPIRLDRLGQWWHRGEPFENRKLIDLFSRSVQRTEGGTWILHIEPYTYPIAVDDTGYFVHRIELEALGQELRAVTMHLTDRTVEALDPSTLHYDDSLRCAIKGGRFEARFLRTPYYQLADFIEVDRLGFKLTIAGSTYRIPPQEDP